MAKFFKLLATKGLARAGIISTPHGTINTPAFMPVGTKASVKSLSSQDLKTTGAQIILGNTYHLYLRPGDKNLKKLGGLHQFMRWSGPILTDSGGFQVSSLGHFIDEKTQNKSHLKRAVIDNKGATFYSHLDGTKHRLTPAKSIRIQANLGADIIMAFDEATPNKGKSYARSSMNRTHRWLNQSIKAWQKLGRYQALFGIIQGGNFRDLRRLSALYVASKDLPGVAIGGGSIGQDPDETHLNVSWVRDILPQDKPLYLMGVGVGPTHILRAIQTGADMFDCVAPTRLARMGYLYTGEFETKKGEWSYKSQFPKDRLNIANSRFRLDQKVIDKACDCFTCSSDYSRAYLHHLFREKELLYYRLATLHNIRVIIRLTNLIRDSILNTS